MQAAIPKQKQDLAEPPQSHPITPQADAVKTQNHGYKRALGHTLLPKAALGISPLLSLLLHPFSRGKGMSWGPEMILPWEPGAE